MTGDDVAPQGQQPAGGEYEMSVGIQKLEEQSTAGDIDVDGMVEEYQRLHENCPIWRLVEDIQQQAMVYWNIIERLKAGDAPQEVRARFVRLRLAPEDLPNPSEHRLLRRAIDKLSKYRSALARLIRDYGGQLIKELSMEIGASVGLAANLGIPPSVSVSIEYTAIAEAQWVATRPAPGAARP